MLRLLKDYISSPTHQWWVNNVWRPAWDKALACLYGIPALLVAFAQQIGDWASSDQIKDLVGQLHVPEWVPQLIVVIAILHFMAHGRDNA